MDRFLKMIFGEEVSIKEYTKLNGLAYSLISSYEFLLVRVGEVEFVVILPLYVQPTIPTLKKHITKIMAAAALPVVYLGRGLSHSKIQGLIRDRIPFIEEEKQIYLPFLGAYLTSKEKHNSSLYDKFSIPAQLLAMMFLYNADGSLPLKKAISFLPYSAMSISRALKELEATGLFYVKRDGVSKIIRADLVKKELFEEMVDKFNSPVKAWGYIASDRINEKMVMAGEDAMAEVSMLAPPNLKNYAVFEKEMDKGLLSGELLDNKAQSKLELWYYPPLLFSKTNIPDPISLVLSLSNIHDERLEQAIEKVMNELWEDEHGTWVKQF